MRPEGSKNITNYHYMVRDTETDILKLYTTIYEVANALNCSVSLINIIVNSGYESKKLKKYEILRNITPRFIEGPDTF
jgi:hypothetical protein